MLRSQFELNFELESKHWWFVARRSILQDIISHLVPPSKDKLIVEVGCGTGGNIAALSDLYTCVGIDPSHDAISLARSRNSAAHFILGFAPGDLGSIAGEADLYIVADVLEHAADDFFLLSSLLASSKPGTLFVLTVPAMRSLWSRHDETHAHYRRYEREQFEELWRRLPVSPLIVSYFNARLYPLVRIARTMNRLKQRTSGRAGTDLEMPTYLVNQTFAAIFRGESKPLLDVLTGQRKSGYRHGVSLLAVLKREAGVIDPRRKPSHAAPDIYDPASSRRDQACIDA